MAPDPQELLPLPPATFHILMSLAEEDRHGYGIIQDVAARTGGALKLSAGNALPVDPADAGPGAAARDSKRGPIRSWTMSGAVTTASRRSGSR